MSDRDPLDFFATPGWVTRAIIPHLPLAGIVLDPGCGNGAILRELIARGVPKAMVRAIEIDVARVHRCMSAIDVDVTVGDFLHASAYPGLVDLIVCNPPFTHAEAFVRRALRLVAPGGTVAMLLRLAFLESRGRIALHREHPADVLVLPRRPSFTGDGKTDSAAMAWFVWGPGRGGRWSVLDVEPRRAAK